MESATGMAGSISKVKSCTKANTETTERYRQSRAIAATPDV